MAAEGEKPVVAATMEAVVSVVAVAGAENAAAAAAAARRWRRRWHGGLPGGVIHLILWGNRIFSVELVPLQADAIAQDDITDAKTFPLSSTLLLLFWLLLPSRLLVTWLLAALQRSVPVPWATMNHRVYFLGRPLHDRYDRSYQRRYPLLIFY